MSTPLWRFRARRLSLLLVAALSACHDWDFYDPRLGEDGTPSAGGSGGAAAVGGAGGAGGVGEVGGSGASGGGVPTTYLDAVLEDGPVTYWRFGESSGAVAADLSRNVDCTYVGVELGQLGAIAGDPNTAAGFDGTNARVECPTLGAIFPGAAFTIELWVRAEADPGEEHRIASHRAPDGSGFTGWLLLFDANMNLVFNQWKVSNTPVASLSAAWPNDGAWHHAVATGDGATIHLYVDGEVVDESAEADFGFVDVTVPIFFGASGGPDTFLSGDLDEIAMYEMELSPTRIQTHYALGVGR